jgi:hypothetical protein
VTEICHEQHLLSGMTAATERGQFNDIEGGNPRSPVSSGLTNPAAQHERDGISRRPEFQRMIDAAATKSLGALRKTRAELLAGTAASRHSGRILKCELTY